jgi:hypothetical protein
MDGEVWQDVSSVPRLLVSSEGRVMYVPHRERMPNGAGKRSYGGQPTFGVWNKQDGRFIIGVDGTTYKIHRLVAEAFHGPSTFEGAVVMHIDENAANNRASNLRWGTQKENLNADGFLTYCRNRTGENSPFAKAGRPKRRLISAFGKTQSVAKWSRDLGMSDATLRRRLRSGLFRGSRGGIARNEADMTTRQRLPDRRQCETLEFEHGGFRYVASVGRFPSGDLAEVFISGPKVGTHVAFAARDASIMCSIGLQYGVPVEAFRHAIARNSDGSASGPLGRLLELLAKETAPR